MIGKKVTIRCKDSMYHGEWGIVKHFDGEYYHVAIANENSLVIFKRKELVVRKEIKK